MIPIEIWDSYTKREVLSAIAKLFDPIGWVFVRAAYVCGCLEKGIRGDIESHNRKMFVHLLSSKTKVASFKSVSLPLLERRGSVIAPEIAKVIRT